MTAILLSISCGLAGGYLGVAIIVLKRYFWFGPKNYGNGDDFPWSVPVGHALLLVIVGLLLAAVSRRQPRPISLRAGMCLFMTLAIWSALLLLPLYGVSSLVLATGLAWQISGGVTARSQRPRLARYTLAALFGLLVTLAAVSSGWRAVREYRAFSGLPAPSRLDRGFAHFEDYPLSLRSLLSRTVAGSWILENVLYRDDFYETKWVRVQSRNASAINRSFLDWLSDRRRDRPFFAYLNYFDAHEPYMPRRAERQPRLDRGGKRVPEGLQTVAQVPC